MSEYKLPTKGFKLLSAEAANEQIAELVGMSFQTFTNTVMFVQKTRGRNVTDFLDGSDAEQKALFASLFGLDAYDEALQLIKPDAKQAGIAFSDLEQNFMSASNELDRLEVTQKELMDDQNAFVLLQADRISKQRLVVEQLSGRIKEASIEELELKLAEELKVLAQEIQSAQNAYTTASKIEQHQQQQLSDCKATVTSLARDIDRTEREYAALQVPIKPTKSDLVLADLLNQTEQVEKELAQLRELKKELDLEKAQHAGKLNKARAQATFAQGVLQEAVSRQQRIVQQREALRKQMDSVTICPTCTQAFASEEARLAALKDLNDRYRSLEDTPLEPLQRVANETSSALAELGIKTFDEAEYKELCGLIATNDQFLLRKKGEIRSKQDEERALELWQVQEQNYRQRQASLTAQIASSTSNLQDTKTKLPALEKGLEDAQKEAGRYKKANLELQNKQAQLQARVEQSITPLRDAFEAGLAELARLEGEKFQAEGRLGDVVERIQVGKGTKEGLEKHLAESRVEVTLYEYLSEAFGTEGVVAELFREFIPDIQRIASDLLLDLTNGELVVTFSPTRELKRKEEGKAVTRSQFDITVEKRNGGSGYELVSGSEQDKAALVVSWALSELASEHSNVSSNLRVFDEAFESLDSRGMERLATMIERKAESSRQIILVITHKAELDFEKKIILTKQAGVTSIERVIS